MVDPVQFMLIDLREKYEAVPSSRAFDRLYDDPEWGHMFAVLNRADGQLPAALLRVSLLTIL